MDSNKNEIQIDPDYESNNSAIRNVELKEVEENKITEEKLRKIIQEEFDKELLTRQNQIKEIEEKIFKAQKLLHLVRYVIISSYYNNKALEYNINNEESVLDPTNELLGQNRIHPALKKLLGNNAANLHSVISCGKRKIPSQKSSTQVNLTTSTENIVLPSLEEPSFKRIKLEPEANSDKNKKPLLRPAMQVKTSENDLSILTNRKKTEHTIIVGNISYYKKSLEQDNLTHKWMVYVRIHKGTKHGPDVSQIISKVVFHLHPSYKPHDVVEISKSPFHLSRRGWGEFPVRVQIAFKGFLDKPVDIIHNLKLDKTFVGRQTIGNETFVSIFLHCDNSPHEENDVQKFNEYGEDIKSGAYNDTIIEDEAMTDSLKIVSSEIKKEGTRLDSTSSTTLEHDYCFDDFGVKSECDEIQSEERNVIEETQYFDHCYSLQMSEECNSQNSMENKQKEVIVNDQPATSLIFGLGDKYLGSGDQKVETAKSFEPELNHKIVSPKVLTTSTGRAIKFLPSSFSKVLLNSGGIVQVKLVQQSNSLLKKNNPQTQTLIHELASVPKTDLIVDRKIDYSKYIVKFPGNRFKCIGEFLPYIFKRLPLWSTLAEDIDYKCTYPFTARSKEEFFTWNIGKQLSCEWSRAKAIKKLLIGQKFGDNWTTKGIIMYGRTHMFSPFLSCLSQMYKNDSFENSLLTSIFSQTEAITCKLNNVRKDKDVYVDIESENDLLARNLSDCDIDITDISLKSECSYVKQAALNCGVVLKPENVAESVQMNAAERMILESVKCFLDGLIRRSRFHLIKQSKYDDESSEITKHEINLALNERSEIEAIRNFEKQRRNLEFFF